MATRNPSGHRGIMLVQVALSLAGCIMPTLYGRRHNAAKANKERICKGQGTFRRHSLELTPALAGTDTHTHTHTLSLSHTHTHTHIYIYIYVHYT